MRVIVVEDDEGSLNGLIRLLESIDPSIKVVGKAGNGKEGLELIEKRIPDVVITDIKMPVMDGLEMIRNLYEKQWKKSHFIIISSYSDFEYARQALRYQVTDYLLKPITYEEIETIMFRLMEKVKPGGNQISDINELYPLPEDVHPLVRPGGQDDPGRVRKCADTGEHSWKAEHFSGVLKPNLQQTDECDHYGLSENLQDRGGKAPSHR